MALSMLGVYLDWVLSETRREGRRHRGAPLGATVRRITMPASGGGASWTLRALTSALAGAFSPGRARGLQAASARMSVCPWLDEHARVIVGVFQSAGGRGARGADADERERSGLEDLSLDHDVDTHLVCLWVSLDVRDKVAVFAEVKRGCEVAARDQQVRPRVRTQEPPEGIVKREFKPTRLALIEVNDLRAEAQWCVSASLRDVRLTGDGAAAGFSTVDIADHDLASALLVLSRRQGGRMGLLSTSGTSRRPR